MSVEYVLFGIEEMRDLKKDLLESQLSALQSQQHLQNYKKLRQEELNQKVKLKSLINQIQEELQVLKKLLPETSYKPTRHAIHSSLLSELDNIPKVQATQEIKNKSNSLESQLDEIRKKLSMLQ